MLLRKCEGIVCLKPANQFLDPNKSSNQTLKEEVGTWLETKFSK
jgi:hypothetical protein